MFTIYEIGRYGATYEHNEYIQNLRTARQREKERKNWKWNKIERNSLNYIYMVRKIYGNSSVINYMRILLDYVHTQKEITIREKGEKNINKKWNEAVVHINTSEKQRPPNKIK